jgi:pimeloyl-ACP methyl ester carboxylesterase
MHEGLMYQLRTSLGGTPDQVPAAYAERSPVGRLSRLEVPTLIVQGSDDVTVPYEQGCLKRGALDAAGRAPSAWFLDRSLGERTDRTDCGGAFRQASVALAATQKYAFVVYEGQGHELDEKTRDHAIALAVGFALAHL